MGLLDGTSFKEPGCQFMRQQRHKFYHWGRKILWRREWQSTPIFLPGKSQGQRGLMAISPWDRKELYTSEVFNSCSVYML